jgi:hypothetical protein
MADQAATSEQTTTTGAQSGGGAAAAGGNTIATGGGTSTTATGTQQTTTTGGQGQQTSGQNTGTTQTTTGAQGTQQTQQTQQTQTPAEIAAKDLKLPQGFEPAAAEQVAGLAKAMGWSKDQAQKYLDHAAAQAPAAQAARAQAQEQQTKGWHEAIANDPTFGGQAFEGTKVNAKRGIDALVKAGHLSQEDIAFLDSSGYGNHPILVKIAASFGKAIGDDTFGGRTAGGGTGKKSDADTFYG